MFGFFSAGVNMQSLIAALPAHYERNERWSQKPGVRTTLWAPSRLTVNILDVGYWLSSQVEIDLGNAVNWDNSGVDYTVPSNRAGKDFYIYACKPSSGNAPKFVLSANQLAPNGYDLNNSRRIGGFHCLCADVGAITGHSLSGYMAGDILPASIWDMKHRPVCDPKGMVYSAAANIWVDIYLASGTEGSTASVFGGVITKSRNWYNFVNDGGAVKKRLLKDFEFQLIAAGSNEQTYINGETDPVTTGGHIDTAGRRMISNIGCEDCCGVMDQWLDEQAYRYFYTTGHTHTENISETYTQNAVTGSASPLVAMEWRYTPNSKGMSYQQGQYGSIKMVAGNKWSGTALASGSQSRNLGCIPGTGASSIGARFCAEKIIHNISYFGV